jgi:hypothetical protein
MKNLPEKIPALIYYAVAAGSWICAISIFYTKFNAGEYRHIWMELAAGQILAGLMCIWCARDYTKTIAVRFFTMFYFALTAINHWIEYFFNASTAFDALKFSVPVIALIFAEIVICKLVRKE